MKPCKICGRSDVKFYADKRNREGYKPVCVDCYNARRNDPNRRAKHIQYIKEYGALQRAERKQAFVNLLGGCCQRCGYHEFASALAFHHVDPASKEYPPNKVTLLLNSQRGYDELNKCVLLCGNCHYAYHAGEWSATFVKRSTFGWTIDMPNQIPDEELFLIA